MRMKTLSAAVLAGLGVAGTAQAVHVNPDGLGQVLLNPYYTVQNGFDTYLHVVNTSSTEVKAVKVRFLEGKNSREVLDFNLYLSPNDEWTGAITRTEAGAGVTSDDTSCIAPSQLPALGSAPQEFRNFEYVGDSVNGTDRTREGYVEIIEMGVVTNNILVGGVDLAAAATHPQTGPSPVPVPPDCNAIRNAASQGGALNDNPTDLVTLPTGGLYGFTTLINVGAGVKASIDAITLDNFFTNPFTVNADLHTSPGSLLPSLNEVNTDADVLDGNQIITSTWTREPVDTVSMVLMHDQIMNDYEVDIERLSRTDWVVTFPTKRFYVNSGQDLAARAPFTELWSPELSASCDPIAVTYWDREEQQEQFQDDFSPRPPEGGTSLCNEVNTLSVQPNGAPSDYATLFGAQFTAAGFDLAPNFQEGWMRIDFDGPNAQFFGQDPLTSELQLYSGLPVIGVAAINNVNNILEIEGVTVLSNYMGSTVHKATRDIQIVAPQ